MNNGKYCMDMDSGLEEERGKWELYGQAHEACGCVNAAVATHGHTLMDQLPPTATSTLTHSLSLD